MLSAASSRSKIDSSLNSTSFSETPEVEVVTFQLDGLEFGCALEQAINFALFRELQDLPDLYISDLNQSFNLNPQPLNPDTRIILVEAGKEIYAFPVSRIHGILRIPDNQIFTPPPILRESISHPGLVGFALIDQRIILLLDLEKSVLLAPRIKIGELGK